MTSETYLHLTVSERDSKSSKRPIRPKYLTLTDATMPQRNHKKTKVKAKDRSLSSVRDRIYDDPAYTDDISHLAKPLRRSSCSGGGGSGKMDNQAAANIAASSAVTTATTFIPSNSNSLGKRSKLTNEFLQYSSRSINKSRRVPVNANEFNRTGAAFYKFVDDVSSSSDDGRVVSTEKSSKRARSLERSSAYAVREQNDTKKREKRDRSSKQRRNLSLDNGLQSTQQFTSQRSRSGGGGGNDRGERDHVVIEDCGQGNALQKQCTDTPEDLWTDSLKAAPENVPVSLGTKLAKERSSSGGAKEATSSTKLQIGRRFLKGEIGIKSFNYYLLKEGLKKSSKKLVEKQRSDHSGDSGKKKPHSQSDENIYEEIFSMNSPPSHEDDGIKQHTKIENIKQADQQRSQTLHPPQSRNIDTDASCGDCLLCLQQCTRDDCRDCLMEKLKNADTRRFTENRNIPPPINSAQHQKRQNTNSPERNITDSRSSNYLGQISDTPQRSIQNTLLRHRGENNNTSNKQSLGKETAGNNNLPASHMLEFQSYNPNNPGVYKIETTPVAITGEYNPILQFQQTTLLDTSQKHLEQHRQHQSMLHQTFQNQSLNNHGYRLTPSPAITVNYRRQQPQQEHQQQQRHQDQQHGYVSNSAYGFNGAPASHSMPHVARRSGGSPQFIIGYQGNNNFNQRSSGKSSSSSDSLHQQQLHQKYNTISRFEASTLLTDPFYGVATCQSNGFMHPLMYATSRPIGGSQILSADSYDRPKMYKSDSKASILSEFSLRSSDTYQRCGRYRAGYGHTRGEISDSSLAESMFSSYASAQRRYFGSSESCRFVFECRRCSLDGASGGEKCSFSDNCRYECRHCDCSSSYFSSDFDDMYGSIAGGPSPSSGIPRKTAAGILPSTDPMQLENERQQQQQKEQQLQLKQNKYAQDFFKHVNDVKRSIYQSELQRGCDLGGPESTKSRLVTDLEQKLLNSETQFYGGSPKRNNNKIRSPSRQQSINNREHNHTRSSRSPKRPKSSEPTSTGSLNRIVQPTPAPRTSLQTTAKSMATLLPPRPMQRRLTPQRQTQTQSHHPQPQPKPQTDRHEYSSKDRLAVVTFTSIRDSIKATDTTPTASKAIDTSDTSVKTVGHNNNKDTNNEHQQQEGSVMVKTENEISIMNNDVSNNNVSNNNVSSSSKPQQLAHTSMATTAAIIATKSKDPVSSQTENSLKPSNNKLASQQLHSVELSGNIKEIKANQSENMKSSSSSCEIIKTVDTPKKKAITKEDGEQSECSKKGLDETAIGVVGADVDVVNVDKFTAAGESVMMQRKDNEKSKNAEYFAEFGRDVESKSANNNENNGKIDDHNDGKKAQVKATLNVAKLPTVVEISTTPTTPPSTTLTTTNPSTSTITLKNQVVSLGVKTHVGNSSLSTPFPQTLLNSLSRETTNLDDVADDEDDVFYDARSEDSASTAVSGGASNNFDNKREKVASVDDASVAVKHPNSMQWGSPRKNKQKQVEIKNSRHLQQEQQLLQQHLNKLDGDGKEKGGENSSYKNNEKHNVLRDDNKKMQSKETNQEENKLKDGSSKSAMESSGNQKHLQQQQPQLHQQQLQQEREDQMITTTKVMTEIMNKNKEEQEDVLSTIHITYTTASATTTTAAAAPKEEHTREITTITMKETITALNLMTVGANEATELTGHEQTQQQHQHEQQQHRRCQPSNDNEIVATKTIIKPPTTKSMQRKRSTKIIPASPDNPIATAATLMATITCQKCCQEAECLQQQLQQTQLQTKINKTTEQMIRNTYTTKITVTKTATTTTTTTTAATEAIAMAMAIPTTTTTMLTIKSKEKVIKTKAEVTYRIRKEKDTVDETATAAAAATTTTTTAAAATATKDAKAGKAKGHQHQQPRDASTTRASTITALTTMQQTQACAAGILWKVDSIHKHEHDLQKNNTIQIPAEKRNNAHNDDDALTLIATAGRGNMLISTSTQRDHHHHYNHNRQLQVNEIQEGKNNNKDEGNVATTITTNAIDTDSLKSQPVAEVEANECKEEEEAVKITTAANAERVVTTLAENKLEVCTITTTTTGKTKTIATTTTTTKITVAEASTSTIKPMTPTSASMPTTKVSKIMDQMLSPNQEQREQQKSPQLEAVACSVTKTEVSRYSDAVDVVSVSVCGNVDADANDSLPQPLPTIITSNACFSCTDPHTKRPPLYRQEYSCLDSSETYSDDSRLTRDSCRGDSQNDELSSPTGRDRIDITNLPLPALPPKKRRCRSRNSPAKHQGANRPPAVNVAAEESAVTEKQDAAKRCRSLDTSIRSFKENLEERRMHYTSNGVDGGSGGDGGEVGAGLTSQTSFYKPTYLFGESYHTGHGSVNARKPSGRTSTSGEIFLNKSGWVQVNTKYVNDENAPRASTNRRDIQPFNRSEFPKDGGNRGRNTIRVIQIDNTRRRDNTGTRQPTLLHKHSFGQTSVDYSIPKVRSSKIEEFINRNEMRCSSGVQQRNAIGVSNNSSSRSRGPFLLRPGCKIIDPQIAMLLNERPGFLPVHNYNDSDSPPPITPILSPPPAFQDTKGKFVDRYLPRSAVTLYQPQQILRGTAALNCSHASNVAKGMVFSRSFEYDNRKPTDRPSDAYVDTFSRSFDGNLSEKLPPPLPQRNRSPNFSTLTGCSPNYLSKKDSGGGSSSSLRSRDNSPKHHQAQATAYLNTSVKEAPSSYCVPNSRFIQVLNADEKSEKSSALGRVVTKNSNASMGRSRKAQFTRGHSGSATIGLPQQQQKLGVHNLGKSRFRSFDTMPNQRLNSCDSGARSDLSNDELDNDDDNESIEFLTANYYRSPSPFKNQRQRSLTPDLNDSHSSTSSLRKQRSLTPESRSLTPEDRRKRSSQGSSLMGSRQNSSSRSNTLERRQKYEEKTVNISRSSSSSSYSGRGGVGNELHDKTSHTSHMVVTSTGTVGSLTGGNANQPRRTSGRTSKQTDEHRIRRSRSLQLTERSPSRSHKKSHPHAGSNQQTDSVPTGTGSRFNNPVAQSSFPSTIRTTANSQALPISGNVEIDKSRSFDFDYGNYNNVGGSNLNNSGQTLTKRLDFDKSRSFDDVDYKEQTNNNNNNNISNSALLSGNPKSMLYLQANENVSNVFVNTPRLRRASPNAKGGSAGTHSPQSSGSSCNNLNMVRQSTSPQNYGTRLCDHELTYDMLRRSLDRSPIMDFRRADSSEYDLPQGPIQSYRNRETINSGGNSELNFLSNEAVLYEHPTPTTTTTVIRQRSSVLGQSPSESQYSLDRLNRTGSDGRDGQMKSDAANEYKSVLSGSDERSKADYLYRNQQQQQYQQQQQQQHKQQKQTHQPRSSSNRCSDNPTKTKPLLQYSKLAEATASVPATTTKATCTFWPHCGACNAVNKFDFTTSKRQNGVLRNAIQDHHKLSALTSITTTRPTTKATVSTTTTTVTLNSQERQSNGDFNGNRIIVPLRCKVSDVSAKKYAMKRPSNECAFNNDEHAVTVINLKENVKLIDNSSQREQSDPLQQFQIFNKINNNTNKWTLLCHSSVPSTPITPLSASATSYDIKAILPPVGSTPQIANNSLPRVSSLIFLGDCEMPITRNRPLNRSSFQNNARSLGEFQTQQRSTINFNNINNKYNNNRNEINAKNTKNLQIIQGHSTPTTTGLRPFALTTISSRKEKINAYNQEQHQQKQHRRWRRQSQGLKLLRVPKQRSISLPDIFQLDG